MRSGRERVENRIQVLIMLLIGGAASAASFRHVHDVAAAHGQPGWLAWANAVVLELASIAAGLELRRNRRLGADPTPPDHTARPTPGKPGPPLIVDAAVPDTREPVPGPPLPVPTGTATVQDPTTAVPDQDLAVPDRRDSDPPVRDGGPEITALVPAARTAAHTLATQGTPLSRKELARQLRADGHHLSNATASALVRVLRAEAAPPAPASPNLSHQEAA
ncbi:DUF2637 domain-containing protein [Micromonospora sp. ATA51]|nr:DUF2637 domain-containing protein [Micromonospora sp. ATA51]